MVDPQQMKEMRLNELIQHFHLRMQIGVVNNKDLKN